jgi:hypothetical protein
MTPGISKEKDKIPSPTDSVTSIVVDKKNDKEAYPKI